MSDGGYGGDRGGDPRDHRDGGGRGRSHHQKYPPRDDGRDDGRQQHHQHHHHQHHHQQQYQHQSRPTYREQRDYQEGRSRDASASSSSTVGSRYGDSHDRRHGGYSRPSPSYGGQGGVGGGGGRHDESPRNPYNRPSSSGGYPPSRTPNPSPSYGGYPPSRPTNPSPMQQQQQLPPAPQQQTDRRSPSSGEQSADNKRRRLDEAGASSSAAAAADGGVAAASSSGAGASGGGRAPRGGERPEKRDRDRLDIFRVVPADTPPNSKCGSSGTHVELKANYFALPRRPRWNPIQYRVDFEPPVEVLGIRKRLLFENRPLLGGYLYDTQNTIYLTHKLEHNPTILQASDREGNAFTITLRSVAVVAMDTRESLQILNIILRRAMGGLQLQLIGRNYFDPQATINVPNHRLQLWPGYTTSIRQHETEVMVCAEITNKVMRTETLLQILQQCLRESPTDWRQSYVNKVLGMTVLTDYNNKTYRIDDVDFNQSPSDTFEYRDQRISFVEYYANKYRVQIRDKQQPLLISRARERDVRGGRDQQLALVPELCRATGLTEEMRRNMGMMRDMAGYFRMAPQTRIERLLDFNRRLQRTPESAEVLQQFNLELKQELVSVLGRRLDNEKLCVANGHQEMSSQKADWNNLFHRNGMLHSVPLVNWVVVYPYQVERDVNDLICKMGQAASNMRYQMEQPRRVSMNDNRTHTYARDIERACSENDPQLVMVIVQNQNADVYAAIKKKCCLDRAVPSQVIFQRTMKHRSLLSVATKVVLQMNCKLGGAAWGVTMPMSGLMTAGFDVTHDKNDRSRSFGALVAMMDLRKGVNFFSAVSQHSNGEELSNDLCINMVKALREFQRISGALPARIVLYRDGVGEGQTEYVFQHEVGMLRQQLKQVYGDDPAMAYKLCFIVVSKRINTRFFMGNQNPPPGTVVDTVVTMPERYDFFIVAQSCHQGTVSPTSYNVLFDNLGSSTDTIQKLTFKMCHMYYNWSGTTRVPAVVQYAHKLAFLVGQFLHRAPESELLEKLLYFL